MSENEYHYYYKYLPFDEGSRKVITEGTVKYTCPLNFNDPFDCRPCYDTKEFRESNTIKPDIVSQLRTTKYPRGFDCPENDKQLRAQIANHVQSIKHVQEKLRKLGVLCLSRDPTNILMWSHYAAFHTGFLVEFKVPHSGQEEEAFFTGENIIAFPVEYASKRPIIKYGIDDDSTLLSKSLLTKSDIWSYEKEVRVIERNRGPGIHSYKREKRLNAVIAGLNMPKSNYETLAGDVESARKHQGLEHLEIFKATASISEYRVEIPSVLRNFHCQ